MEKLTDKQRKMVEDNLGLVYKATECLSYIKDREEIISIGFEKLCEAAQKYDKTKGSFSNYAYLQIKYAYFHEARMIAQKSKRLINLDAQAAVDKEDGFTVADVVQDRSESAEDRLIDEETYLEIKDIIKEQLTKREKEFLSVYLNSKNCIEVAKKIGVSPQAAYFQMKKIRKRVLFFYENRLTF